MRKLQYSATERFFNFVSPEPNSGCWLWTGDASYFGYGRFWLNGKRVQAHRFSWELHNKAEIPKGLFVCHSCDVGACVNPSHLWLGSQSENMHDSYRKGRKVGTNKGKYATECLRGHKYSGDNLYISPKGFRQCRACNAAKMRRTRRNAKHHNTIST